jgi:hypothetical protein
MIPPYIHPLIPHNRFPRRTRHLNPTPLERLAKHTAQIIPHLVAVDIVREDLLRTPVEQPVWCGCEFERDAARAWVAVQGLEVEAAYWGVRMGNR